VLISMVREAVFYGVWTSHSVMLDITS